MIENDQLYLLTTGAVFHKFRNPAVSFSLVNLHILNFRPKYFSMQICATDDSARLAICFDGLIL